MEEGIEETVPLRIPTEEFCLGCHEYKPSHTMIPTNGKFSFEKYWKEIAHPENRSE
jgi:hypothetical protein